MAVMNVIKVIKVSDVMKVISCPIWDIAVRSKTFCLKNKMFDLSMKCPISDIMCSKQNNLSK